jgi:large subunit ribosomal protein L1
MAKLTKNQKKALAVVDITKEYSLTDAAGLLKKASFTKFDSSVDIDVRLEIGRAHV